MHLGTHDHVQRAQQAGGEVKAILVAILLVIVLPLLYAHYSSPNPYWP